MSGEEESLGLLFPVLFESGPVAGFSVFPSTRESESGSLHEGSKANAVRMSAVPERLRILVVRNRGPIKLLVLALRE